MLLGIVFPTTDIGNDHAAIREWAQGAHCLFLNTRGCGFTTVGEHLGLAERFVEARQGISESLAGVRG